MRKILIFMLMCFCCIGIKAQDSLTDNFVKTDSIEQKEIVEQRPMLLFHKRLLIENLEDEYDVIYDEVSPHEVLASRGNKCYIVDIFTGKETVVDNKKDEDKHVVPDNRKLGFNEDEDDE